MRPVRLVVVLAALALLAPAGARAAVPAVNVAGAPTHDVLADALSTGTKQVRIFAQWKDFEPDAAGQYPPAATPATATENNLRNLTVAFDAAIRQLNAAGAEPIFVVVGAPRWANDSTDTLVPPRDPVTYAQFFGEFVAHNAAVGRVAAYEVWNEQDADGFWHAPVDAARYTALLKAAYAAAKPKARDAVILAGPFTGNNFPYLEAMYDAGAQGSFDGVAVHTDSACLGLGPDFFFRDGGRISRFVFLAYREVRASMAAHGDLKPIWMTELGWSSTGAKANSCVRGAGAGQRPDGVTEAQQAEFLTQAYGCLANDPDVVSGGWFTMRDTRTNTPDELNHYGLLRADGSPKPSFAAFKAVVAADGGPPVTCGDFEPPTVRIVEPVPGQQFVDRIDVRAVAQDAGVGVTSFTFSYDGGERIRSFGVSDGAADGVPIGLAPWYGSSQLALGPHTLEVVASDRNGNVARVEVPVVKVDPASVVASLVPAFRVGAKVACAKRLCRVRGGVTRAVGGPPLRGRVAVEWQVRNKQGRYVRMVGGTKVAATSFVFRLKAKQKGRWRVKVSYLGQTPYKPVAARYLTFRIRR